LFWEWIQNFGVGTRNSGYQSRRQGAIVSFLSPDRKQIAWAFFRGEDEGYFLYQSDCFRGGAKSAERGKQKQRKLREFH
jgi:hypothetical protein